MSEIVGIVRDYLLTPALICITGAILMIIRSYADRITKSIVSRNETESLEKITSMKTNFLSQIDMVAETAVGANMGLAQDMKTRNEKLTMSEINQLNNNAKKIILDAMPESVKHDGPLLKVLGGQNALESIVEGLIEKHVHEYKIKHGKNLL